MTGSTPEGERARIELADFLARIDARWLAEVSRRHPAPPQWAMSNALRQEGD